MCIFLQWGLLTIKIQIVLDWICTDRSRRGAFHIGWNPEFPDVGLVFVSSVTATQSRVNC